MPGGKMFLPVNLNVKGRLCVIVGGGAVAERKCRKLLEYGARVRLVSPGFARDDGEWALSCVERMKRPYGKDALTGAFLVIAATSDPEVNGQVLSDAAGLGILAQRADSPEEGDFTFPATLRRGHLTVSFATGGISPALSARLKAEAACRYGAAHGGFLHWLRFLKDHPAWTRIPRERRKEALAEMFGEEVLERLSRGEEREARRKVCEILRRSLKAADDGRDGTPGMPGIPGKPGSSGPGKVFLVGAGPGDPGLLTVKGMECLLAADTVLTDGIVDPSLVAMYCPEAERIDVGKRKGRCGTTQDEIIALLIEKARAGRTVVRLKGGDPLIFGRGGEEARALHRAGIPYEIVPGVSSVSAVPAYAGIPVTDREYASSFEVYSAHRKGGLCFSDEEWERIARAPGTLIFLMGATRCETVARKLLECGRSPETPIALICDGTTPRQSRIAGTLESFLAREGAMEAAAPAPGLIVVGEVVRSIPEMDWYRPGGGVS